MRRGSSEPPVLTAWHALRHMPACLLSRARRAYVPAGGSASEKKAFFVQVVHVPRGRSVESAQVAAPPAPSAAAHPSAS